MVLMEWKDSYSVGVDALDADHMRLIAIINKVDEADRAGKSVQWALEELRNYAEFHFKAEEARMKAASYPDVEEHMR